MHFLIFFVAYLFSYATLLRGEEFPYRFEGRCEGWKDKKLELITLFLPPNPIIVQAGACYGNETASFASKWPSSTIIAFEPNPHAFEFFLKNTKNYKNVYGFNLALNEQLGKATLYVCHGPQGNNPSLEYASSLLKPSHALKDNLNGPQIEVDCVVLDDWCEEHRIAHIDFLRLDVEGFELQVLKNSPKILRTINAIYVQTNFFPFRVGTTPFEKLRKFLEQSGFTLLSHWYQEGLEGSAIFIKNDFFEGNL